MALGKKKKIKKKLYEKTCVLRQAVDADCRGPCPNSTRRGQLPRRATKDPPSISVHGLPLKYSCSDFAFFPSSFWVICGTATT